MPNGVREWLTIRRLCPGEARWHRGAPHSRGLLCFSPIAQPFWPMCRNSNTIYECIVYIYGYTEQMLTNRLHLHQRDNDTGGGLSQCAWNRAAEHPFEYVATWARRGRRGGRDTAAIRRRPNFHTRSERMKIVLHDSTTTRLRMVVRSAGSAVTQPPRVAGSMKNRRRSTAP